MIKGSLYFNIKKTFFTNVKLQNGLKSVLLFFSASAKRLVVRGSGSAACWMWASISRNYWWCHESGGVALQLSGCPRNFANLDHLLVIFPQNVFQKWTTDWPKWWLQIPRGMFDLSVGGTESPLRRSKGRARASTLSPWSADLSCGLWTSAAVWVSSPAATRAANDPSRKINNYRESMLNKPPRPLSLMIFVSASQFHIFMWLWNIREPSF